MSGLFPLLRIKMATGSLQVTFRSPVPVGAELFLPVRLDARAERRYYASGEGRVGAPDGPVAVEANAVFFEVDLAYFDGMSAPAELAGFNPELRG